MIPRDRMPLAFRPLEGALESAQGNGLAVVVAGTGFHLAFTTAFGPCVRSHDRGGGDAFLLRVIRESAGSEHAEIAVAGAGPFASRLQAIPGLDVSGPPSEVSPDEARAGLEAFSRRRASVPVHSGRGALARARLTAIAPCPGTAYERGTVLRCAIEPRGAGCVLRWRRPDGGDAGIHLVLDRMPGERERALVEGAEGLVAAATPGSMPWRDGTRRVQVLVIDVAHAFAEALPDGRMPRHGLAGEEP